MYIAALVTAPRRISKQRHTTRSFTQGSLRIAFCTERLGAYEKERFEQ